MMDAESPLEGLATDQLASEIVTYMVEDKRVLPRSNMEEKAKFMQNSPFMLGMYNIWF